MTRPGLPGGTQAEVLAAARRDALTTDEVHRVIDLLHEASPEQEALILEQPRRVLMHVDGVVSVRDPRMSPAGNRLARQLNFALESLGRIENWHRHPGLAELKRDDRRLLAPSFTRLARTTRTVADLVDDLWKLESSEAPS